MKRLYVIGDKETGVAFVTLDPLRAALVSREVIQKFADASGRGFEGVFGDIAKAIQTLIVRSDAKTRPANVAAVPDAFGALIEGGSIISDAEFCFIADLADGKWETFRNPFPPIEDSLDHLAVGKEGYEDTVYPSKLHYGAG